MGEKIDLRAYWQLFFKWWWILVLGIVVGSAGAYLSVRGNAVVYEATAQVIVEGGSALGPPTSSEIDNRRQLASYFTSLITTRRMLERVAEQISPQYQPGALANNIKVDASGSIIDITVTDANPVTAADIANTVAETFVDDVIDRQLAQIARFQSSLRAYGIAEEPSIIAAQAATLSSVSVIESALPPVQPISTRALQNIVLAAAVGLIAAGLIVIMVEYLDDSVKTAEDLESATGLAPLAWIPSVKDQDGWGLNILDDETSRSTLSEAYKFLATNLEFTALEAQGVKSVLITSAVPSEGKSTTAANFGASLARDGKSVILVDADLRRPTLNTLVRVDFEKGLTHALLGNITAEMALAETSIPGLRVLLSGPSPPNPTAVLRSRKMREVLAELKDLADLVIIDSPPVLAVTDAMVLAPLVECVLVVVESQSSKKQDVRRAVEQVRQANGPIVCAVLNKVRQQTGGSQHYYYYYHNYYQSNQDGQDNQNGRSRVRGFFARIAAKRGGARARKKD